MNNNFLNQEKLTKKEWDNIETIISDLNEREILNMINNGYYNTDIKINKYKCLYQYLNIQKNYYSIIYFELLHPIIKKSIFQKQLSLLKNKVKKILKLLL